MHTDAVILSGPKDLAIGTVALDDPGDSDVVVDIAWSGISTGTEKLLWSGEMPNFPGMGYPLIPGYEACGTVVEAGAQTDLSPGDFVFVPGATCFGPVRGLFGGAAARVVTPAARVAKMDAALGPRGALLALAATARHTLAAPDATLPDLIVGHGALGRLLARLTMALGGPPPTVWETDTARSDGATGYAVCHPDADTRHDYRTIYDASGQAGILNALIARLAKGGEVVLAGFYSTAVSFAYPPAFMKEARLRVAAEWTPDDLIATRDLIEDGALSLDGLISHTAPAAEAPAAYETAFADHGCLKMILDWRSAS
ncbi:MAG: chlorophyll synthesis pathway protein BchC [Pseudomonadota bacterium]